MADATKPRIRPASDFDRRLGRRVARRRREIGMSPAELDEAISAPAGSVEAFEEGARSVDAGQLFALSRALRVPVLYFFENVPQPANIPTDDVPEARRIREAELFINAYFRIADPKLRRDILGLLKAAADRLGLGDGDGGTGPGG